MLGYNASSLERVNSFLLLLLLSCLFVFCVVCASDIFGLVGMDKLTSFLKCRTQISLCLTLALGDLGSRLKQLPLHCGRGEGGDGAYFHINVREN